jgi:hypothetical protein
MSKMPGVEHVKLNVMPLRLSCGTSDSIITPSDSNCLWVNLKGPVFFTGAGALEDDLEELLSFFALLSGVLKARKRYEKIKLQ